MHLTVQQEQWNAENAFAEVNARLNAFIEIANAPMREDAARADDIQNHLRAMAEQVLNKI